jgi:hypothetical protein
MAEEAPWWLRDGDGSPSGSSSSAASDAVQAPSPGPPKRVLDGGRYEVVRVIGSGAYATVSLAVDRNTRSQVFPLRLAPALAPPPSDHLILYQFIYIMLIWCCRWR